MSGVVMSRLAPAKINLFLHITGRRANGYHDLESLFVFADFGDEILIEEGEGLELDVKGPFAGSLVNSSDNLVLLAAQMLAETSGKDSYSARITLIKNLPVSAGIGGGSSDAAATLLALNQFWDLGKSKNDLAEMAPDLGADVPACIYGKASFVSGIGENVTPLEDFPELAILMVNPGTGLSTAQVFKSLRESDLEFSPVKGMPQNLCGSTQMEVRNWLESETRNDLQPAATSMAPEIGAVLETLELMPGCLMARMSGSGPTCFALFDIFEDAIGARSLLNSRASWWVQEALVS